MKKLTCIIALLVLANSAILAAEAIVVSKVIHAEDSALHFRLSAKQWIKITNFTQTGGDPNTVGIVAVFQGSADLPGANVLVATQSTSTKVEHEDVFIAGPTVVYVAPVPGATLFISYLRGSN